MAVPDVTIAYQLSHEGLFHPRRVC